MRVIKHSSPGRHAARQLSRLLPVTAVATLLLLCACPGRDIPHSKGVDKTEGITAASPGAGHEYKAEEIEALAPAEAYSRLEELDGGVDCERFAEHCFAGEIMQVHLYLRSGGDPNCRTQTPERSSGLIAAAAGSQKEIVAMLLAAGADTELREPETESTALILAAREGSLDVLSLLLDAGADVFYSDKGSFTAIHVAAANGHTEILRELIARGVNPDLQSEKKGPNAGGLTPLLYAALGGHSEATHYLVEEAEADPKHIANNGSSASMAALHLKNLELAKYLYSKGSPPLCFYNNNMSTLALAAQIGYIEGINWLVQEVGADVDTRNKRDGATPLIVSVTNGYSDCTSRLLELGADPSIKDADGRTAFDIAREGKLDEVLKILQGGGKADPQDSSSQPPTV